MATAVEVSAHERPGVVVVTLNRPAQHNAHSTLRAIETRRWLVRAANTGISRIVAPTGQTIDSLGLNQAGFLIGEIEGRDNQTIYVRFGDWFVALCAIMIVGLFAANRKHITEN